MVAAIVALKEELKQCTARNVEPVLEEFIPLKNNKKENNHNEEDGTTKKEKDSNNCSSNKEKKNWMSSVQLWNTDGDDHKVDIKVLEFYFLFI